MSYARFGWGGSSVYIYLDVDGDLRCCSCWLEAEVPSPPALASGFHRSFKAYSTAEMIGHLREHRERGHTVEDSTFRELEDDAGENDAWIKSKQGQEVTDDK